MFGKSSSWWSGKNSLFGKISGIDHFQDRSSDWWVGENSLFASAMNSTKYGKSSGGSVGEADIIKYGIMGLFVWLVIKK